MRTVAAVLAAVLAACTGIDPPAPAALRDPPAEPPSQVMPHPGDVILRAHAFVVDTQGPYLTADLAYGDPYLATQMPNRDAIADALAHAGHMSKALEWAPGRIGVLRLRRLMNRGELSAALKQATALAQATGTDPRPDPQVDDVRADAIGDILGRATVDHPPSVLAAAHAALRSLPRYLQPKAVRAGLFAITRCLGPRPMPRYGRVVHDGWLIARVRVAMAVEADRPDGTCRGVARRIRRLLSLPDVAIPNHGPWLRWLATGALDELRPTTSPSASPRAGSSSPSPNGPKDIGPLIDFALRLLSMLWQQSRGPYVDALPSDWISISTGITSFDYFAWGPEAMIYLGVPPGTEPIVAHRFIELGLTFRAIDPRLPLAQLARHLADRLYAAGQPVPPTLQDFMNRNERLVSAPAFSLRRFGDPRLVPDLTWDRDGADPWTLRWGPTPAEFVAAYGAAVASESLVEFLGEPPADPAKRIGKLALLYWLMVRHTGPIDPAFNALLDRWLAPSAAP